MENSKVILMVILGMLSLWPMVVMGSPKLHKVGGSKGWNEKSNYTQWSSQQHVYVGDWLIFVFDKRYYNVLEVNKTSYENCLDTNFIKNVTRGGRDVVQLIETKIYYFISSGGYCFHGMKVAINIQQHQTPTSAPAPSASQVDIKSDGEFDIKSDGEFVSPSIYTCFGIMVLNVVYVSLISIGIW